MANNIVIVESPAKSKTLKKYLGADFDILASYGHVRDLIPKQGSVDPEDDFAMKYEIIEKNKKHLDAIIKAVKNAEALYLATDPDREGEAIAWHIFDILKEKKALAKKPVYRVAFNEITKTAVQYAIQHPRELSQPLIDAQVARRALDFLVGFNLSPLLWKKIRRGLSAGRVQSPALRMIVDREAEINAFVTQEYWTISANLSKDMLTFDAKLTYYNGAKLEQFSINNEEAANQARTTLLSLAPNNKLHVKDVQKSKRQRNPQAPFITSTLQQDAIRKLGFTAQKTMRIAQELYEGIDTGEGAVGLITYMRTDSVNLAQEALQEIRSFIAAEYGDSYLPAQVRVFKSKSKNAQEAHEAIRPTAINVRPEKIKNKLSGDQYKLYNLIWQRTLACQMVGATLEQVAIELECGEPNIFKATGSTILHPGFLKVYADHNEDTKSDETADKILPPIAKGDLIDLIDIKNKQHFTEPPPRYNEATLVKSLEEYGIGRPSTYASIISTLQQREYVALEAKRFIPTDTGKIVNSFLSNHFTQYVDYDFTAKLEDSLDDISRGETKWLPVLQGFWQTFISMIKHVDANIQRKDVTQEILNESCPLCESPLAKRLGRNGFFIGCTKYPDCDYTRDVNKQAVNNSDTPNTGQESDLGRNCPKCNAPLIVKTGKYGQFIACSSYPKCKHVESMPILGQAQITCPACNKGAFIQRRSKYGSYFYACNNYPTCKYLLRYPPLATSCTKCNWPIVMLKTTKSRGKEKLCPQENCRHSEPYEG